MTNTSIFGWKYCNVSLNVNSSWQLFHFLVKIAKSTIANAVAEFHSKTFIRFRPKVEFDEDYLYFMPDDGYGLLSLFSLKNVSFKKNAVNDDNIH